MNLVIIFFLKGIDDKEDVIPFILPCWDHTPRSGKKGRVLVGSTPLLFKKHVKHTLNGVMHKQNKLIMLKSWNEWAEGNYMEPDLKWGKQYITALKEVINLF